MSDIKNAVKNIFFVPKCRCCGKLAPEGNICAQCRIEVESEKVKSNCVLPKIAFSKRTYVSYLYKGKTKQSLQKAKFNNPAAFLNSFLADISIDIEKILSQNNIDMVISSPCHKSKLFTQEFDLPMEMAKRICTKNHIPYSQCIKKVKNTKKQHFLSLEKRKTNLIGAFEVIKDINGKNILIIDDIISSGSTISAIATQLKLAGCENIYVWAYAYNQLRKDDLNGKQQQ